jgi:lipopolysaccharide export system protein LptC
LRHPVVLLLVLALIIGAIWLLTDSPAPTEDPATADPATGHLAGHQVDYYLRGLHATTMGEDGRPARTLRAAHVKHFQDDDTTELIEPQLIVFQGEQPPWKVRAESGWVSPDGKLVLLNDEVHIEREAGGQTKPVHIQTSNLRVQPHQDYAETDEQVRVRSDQDWIDATGMQAWLRQPSRIKFLADVKGFYAPPQ